MWTAKEMTLLSTAKKALKLFDDYDTGLGGYIVIGRIPNSKRFDCYYAGNVNERASYNLSSSESKQLVIYRMDLRDEAWKITNFHSRSYEVAKRGRYSLNRQRHDPDYRLDRLMEVLHDEIPEI